MYLTGYVAASLWVAVLLAPPAAAQESKEKETSAYVLDIRSFGAACDGRDDARAVQAAIDALPDGAILQLPCRAGIGASGLVLNNRRGVKVMGTEGGGFQALEPIYNRVLLRLVSCTDCTVADLTIDGGNLGVAALALDRCTGTTVQNNTITNIGYPAQAAIVGSANRNNRYIGNLIANTGILYNWNGEIADATRGMWFGNENPEYYEWHPQILENRLRNIGGTAIVVHAFSATIERNVGENLVWSGVKVVAPAGSGGTTRVAGNTFTGTGGRYSGGGIQLGSEPGNGETIVVEDNTIEGDRDSGIYAVRGPVRGRIVNNTFRNNREAGITVLASTGSLLVQGNRIGSDKPGRYNHGIRIIADHGVVIRDIEIAGNEIRGKSENGILIQTNGGTIEGVSVHSNTLADLGWYGVLIEEKAGPNAIRNIDLGPNCFLQNRLGALSDSRVRLLRQPSPVCPAQPDR